MHAEQIEWMRGFANKLGCRLSIDGEIGFGRRCVGLLYEGHYLAYGYYGFKGDETLLHQVYRIVHESSPEDAYHKDDYVAVLGEGWDALTQLYDWLKAIESAGLKTEVVEEPDYGPGSTSISRLLYGKPAQIMRLVMP